MVVITGNPFAMQGRDHYQGLEDSLAKNLSAVVINDEVEGDDSSKKFLKRARANKRMPNFPYPNPIKLLNRRYSHGN